MYHENIDDKFSFFNENKVFNYANFYFSCKRAGERSYFFYGPFFLTSFDSIRFQEKSRFLNGKIKRQVPHTLQYLCKICAMSK